MFCGTLHNVSQYASALASESDTAVSTYGSTGTVSKASAGVQQQRRQYGVATKCRGGKMARRFLEDDHAAGAESLLHNCCARRNHQSHFCEATVRSTTTQQRRKSIGSCTMSSTLLAVAASSSGSVLRELPQEAPSSGPFRDTLVYSMRVRDPLGNSSRVTDTIVLIRVATPCNVRVRMYLKCLSPHAHDIVRWETAEDSLPETMPCHAM